MTAMVVKDDLKQGADSKQQLANVSESAAVLLERSRSGTSSRSSDLAKDQQGTAKFRDVPAPAFPRDAFRQHRSAALQSLAMDRSSSLKEGRKKGNRDFSGIRREDVERKREEIGKERPRLRDENERRKEALALLRFKLEAHIKRTEKKEVKRDVDSSDDWGPKFLRKLADDTDRISGRGHQVAAPGAAAAAEAEETIVVVSGSAAFLQEATDGVLRQPADSGGLISAGPSAGEDGNVTVKDIYVVESVNSFNLPSKAGGEESESDEPSAAQKEEEANQAPARMSACSVSSNKSGRDRSANHLKLAEKVAKMMEDLDAPTELPTPGGLARLKLRVMEDGDTGPIVLMKCSSRDHARVVCETLSAKLGPEETIVINTSEGTKRQQHHFHFQGTNLLASFLKKAFSSRARSKSRPPKRSDSANVSVGNTQTFDSSTFESSLFSSSGVFKDTTKDYIAATWGQDTTRDANQESIRAVEEGGSARPQGNPELLDVQKRVQDNGVSASTKRRIRSANASPAPCHVVDESPARHQSSGYIARLFATPARNLERAKSVGRHRQSRMEDESGKGKAPARFFSFVSPGRGKLQHRFEDRLGPDGKVAADVKGHKTKIRDRLFSFSSPARRNHKRTAASGDTALQDRERWSGLVGSPVGERGRGFGGASSFEQSWGFLGGLGSPVRDNRKCGNGWGPLYSLTDVANESGDQNTDENREEPTSPEVTCIGRVKARAPRCPHSKALAHSWAETESVDTRNPKLQPQGTLPHSGPVFSVQAPGVPKASGAQPKQSRWKTLLGLYRSRAASQGSPLCGDMENDICLSRCQKTSFRRFEIPGQEQGTKGEATSMRPVQTGCESCGEPKPCGTATCSGGRIFMNSLARDSIQAWLAGAVEEDMEAGEPWTGTSNPDHTNSTEGPSPNLVLMGDKKQQTLWQRRHFSRPESLDLGFTPQAA